MRSGKHAGNQRYLDNHPSQIPRRVIYNDLIPIEINLNETPTSETQRQADHLFERVKQSTHFKSSKVNEKRDYLHYILHALKRAVYHNGCVRYSRAKHQKCFDMRLQVIDALIEIKLVSEARSPPGSPKMSRLLPMPELKKYVECDPWTFDPNPMKQFVYLVDRVTKEDLPFDLSKPTPSDTQSKLALINKVNTGNIITYSPYCDWEDDYLEPCQIRPIHFAKFTDHWNWHGRIYTRQYGHQNLKKYERRTIKFNDCPSVELDYGGMHPRLLYHLRKIDYQSDPYALWGEKTTKKQRLLAKKIINTAINAKSKKDTINSCRMATFKYKKKTGRTGLKVKKSGKELIDAILLEEAIKTVGVSLKCLYELALKHHAPIKKHFSSDAGMRLMRHDSSIALDILHHFAKSDIPCLSCHDSFIVPQQYESALREAMHQFYLARLGYNPVVK